MAAQHEGGGAKIMGKSVFGSQFIAGLFFEVRAKTRLV